MAEEKEEINRALEAKGIDPSESFIVRKKVMYVPSDDLKVVEIFQFIASLLMLVGGVFLGVLLTPSSSLLLPFCIVGLLLICGGIVLFIFGVHNQFKEWEKEKIPVSKVN